ncbi:MAG: hypothetical protein KJ063_02295 [Anaerolineae bacterium]|nr:hypothetical protein [Anaerolineae bacterium]
MNEFLNLLWGAFIVSLLAFMGVGVWVEARTGNRDWASLWAGIAFFVVFGISLYTIVVG